MAVCRRDLPGHDQLHTSIKIGGDLGLSAQARIFENKNSPLGFLGGDKPACLEHIRAYVVKAPGSWSASAPRLRGHKVCKRQPQSSEVLLVNLFVKSSPFRCAGRRGNDGVVLHGLSPA